MRGQFAIQFNWVFAILAGFLFLLFFFAVIKSVLQTSGERAARDTSFRVETILVESSGTSGRFATFTVPRAAYHFACEAEDGVVRESYVRVNEEAYNPVGLRDTPVFTPLAIRGGELFVETKEWNAPFPVTNLVLVANNQTRFVFITGSERRKELLARLLEEEGLSPFGHDLLLLKDLDEYEDEGFGQYVFVYWGASYQRPPSAFWEKGRAVLVQEEPPILEFYDRLSSPEPTSYWYGGLAMVEAALFAGNSALFACNMLKAEERFRAVKALLAERLALLLEEESLARCYDSYREGAYILESLPGPASENEAFGAAMKRGGLADRLARLNKELLVKNCPLIY